MVRETWVPAHTPGRQTQPDGARAEQHATTLVLVGDVYWPYVDQIKAAVSTPLEVRVAATGKDDDVSPLLADAEVAVTSRWTAAMRDAAPRLRFIQIPGAGWDKIDGDAIPDGVLVANCYEHEWGIAEYVLMVSLALTRHLLPADRALRRDSWAYHFNAGHPLYPELRGKIMGIVGLGRIGRAVARLASAFRMTCIGVDVQPPPHDVAATIPLAWAGGAEDLDALLARADFVVLAVPLNGGTRNLLTRHRLALLQPSAVLINVARAELIDEADLYEALQTRRFAGAALDPWWFYPEKDEPRAPSRLPFRDLENVILTPHYSGSTLETMRDRMRIVAENIDRYLHNLPPVNIVPELSRP